MVQLVVALRSSDRVPFASQWAGTENLSPRALSSIVGPIGQEFTGLSVPTASSQELDKNLKYLGLTPSMHAAVSCVVSHNVDASRHGGICLSHCMHGADAKSAQSQGLFPKAMNWVRLSP
jgi:hypothetical protein